MIYRCKSSVVVMCLVYRSKVVFERSWQVIIMEFMHEDCDM